MPFTYQHITNINGVAELYSTVKNFCENALGWTVKETGTSGTGKDYAIFYTAGESGQDNVYLGLTWYYVDDEKCGLQWNAYTGYSDTHGFCNLGAISCNVYNSAYRYLPTTVVQDTTLHAYLLGDKDCCIGVVRCVTLYPCFYVGLLRRYWSRQYDPLPLYLFGSLRNGYVPSDSKWNDDQRLGGFSGWYNSSTRNYMWYSWDSWVYGFKLEWGSSGVRDGGSRVVLWPMAKGYGADLIDPSKYFVIPFIINDETGERGEMKWVYKLSRAHDLNPEDEVTVEDVTYKVFPSQTDLNLNRWYAIRWC